MNEKPKFALWDKLKKIKHIEIYIAIIFIVVLLLIYLSNFSGTKSSKSNTLTNELSITGYVESLESNLEDILGNIGGVSNVKVMITLDLSNTAISDQQLTLDKMPPIKGVLVTAKGVENVANKMKVLHAIEAVIDVKNGNIQILSTK